MSRLAFALPIVAVLIAPACGGGSDSSSGGGGGSGASANGGTGGAASGTGGTNPAGSGGATSGGTATGGTATGGASGSGATSGSSASSGQGGSAGNGGGGNGGAGEGGASGAGAGGMPGGAGMGGASQGGRGGQSGQGGGAACGTVADSASPVAETQRTGSPPAPMGGTLTDGTYHLTAWNLYPPATADSDMHSATLRIASGMFEVVVDGSSRQSGAVSTAGVVLTFTPSCPAASPASKPYSATPTTLSLVTVAENRVEVLTKQ